MYINDNKIHGFHHIVNQIKSLHDFVHGIVRGLSPANHDRVLTQGTIPGPMLKLVNHKGNPLIHQFVQVRSGTRHFRHHANLKPEKKFLSVKVMRRRRMWLKNHSRITGDPAHDGNDGS